MLHGFLLTPFPAREPRCTLNELLGGITFRPALSQFTKGHCCGIFHSLIPKHPLMKLSRSASVISPNCSSVMCADGSTHSCQSLKLRASSIRARRSEASSNWLHFWL